MRFWKELRAGDVEEEAHKEAEQCTECGALEHDCECSKHASHRRDGVYHEPTKCGPPRRVVRDAHAHRADAVGEVMKHDHRSDDESELDARVKRGADREPIEKAVHTHATSTERSDVLVAIDRHTGLMAHVDQRDSLEQVEDQETDSRKDHGALD